MNTVYKANGYNSVSPYLVVDGAVEAIAFLERVFGAEEIRRFEDDAGKIIHAEVRIDDTVVMIADGAPPNWTPVAAHVHVYVEDVDASYQEALNSGAESVQQPVKKDDDDKRGGVKDPSGTTWWIATRLG